MNNRDKQFKIMRQNEGERKREVHMKYEEKQRPLDEHNFQSCTYVERNKTNIPRLQPTSTPNAKRNIGIDAYLYRCSKNLCLLQIKHTNVANFRRKHENRSFWSRESSKS